jgi:Secretion system C-terminal sorting domain
MKFKGIFVLLLLLVLILDGASIQFSNQYIFYGIGEDTTSGYWEISRIKNDFSEQDIGHFDPQTQLWLHHHQFSIYMSEGDSVDSYTYLYRYYLKNEPPSDWIELYPHYFGQYIHDSGFWYGFWSLDSTALFSLPLDTGTYSLEFSYVASVRDTSGDTLVSEYVTPDSLPMRCDFSVIDPENSNSESSLAISLAYFTARYEKGKVCLEWRCESETENSHFLIYRDDSVIGHVEGNGSTTEPHDYAFVDDKIQPGVHAYAIADVTYEGEEVMHDAVEIEIKVKLEAENANFVLNKAYPNPFNPSVTINFQLSTFNRVTAVIYNTSGELIKELINTEMTPGSYDLTWDASGMPSGVYIVKLVAQNTVQTQKVVLMK